MKVNYNKSLTIKSLAIRLQSAAQPPRKHLNSLAI
jgi:hypothetical protein